MCTNSGGSEGEAQATQEVRLCISNRVLHKETTERKTRKKDMANVWEECGVVSSHGCVSSIIVRVCLGRWGKGIVAAATVLIQRSGSRPPPRLNPEGAYSPTMSILIYPNNPFPCPCFRHVGEGLSRCSHFLGPSHIILRGRTWRDSNVTCRSENIIAKVVIVVMML